MLFRSRNYPVGNKVDLVERLLDRGVAAPGTDTGTPAAGVAAARPITRNRQPGQCCDTGCTAPGRAAMVDLPKVLVTLPSRQPVAGG